MANLVVRNIDDDIVRALKEKAGRSGHSAEAEHRLILSCCENVDEITSTFLTCFW